MNMMCAGINMKMMYADTNMNMAGEGNSCRCITQHAGGLHPFPCCGISTPHPPHPTPPPCGTPPPPKKPFPCPEPPPLSLNKHHCPVLVLPLHPLPHHHTLPHTWLQLLMSTHPQVINLPCCPGFTSALSFPTPPGDQARGHLQLCSTRVHPDLGLIHTPGAAVSNHIQGGLETS
jgi:hypothetical protein